jgi:hypothetical protein
MLIDDFSADFINKLKDENITAIVDDKMNDTINTNSKVKCHLFVFDFYELQSDNNSTYRNSTMRAYNYWSNGESIQFSQIFNHFFLSIYFGKKKEVIQYSNLMIFFVHLFTILVFISLNYVCIEKNIWSYLPFRNRTWTKTIILL